jgi:hypothetical protein
VEGEDRSVCQRGETFLDLGKEDMLETVTAITAINVRR